MMKKIFAMACALCLTTAMFASCGDTSEGGNGGETTTTTAAPAETDAPAESEAPAETTEAPAESEAPAETEAVDFSDQPYIDEVTGLECFKPDEGYEPVTEFKGYDAFLMYASNPEWFWQNMAGQGYPEDQRGAGAFGIDADITGDGTYTVSITKESMTAMDPVLNATNPQILVDENEGVVFPATGPAVFCVDITGICDGSTNADGEETKKSEQKRFTDEEDYNVNKQARGKYTGQEISVVVDSIKADGEEVEFVPENIVYGNIESNNNCYRIELYNDYGKTKDAPAIDRDKLMFAKSLEVTFTITGLTKEEDAGEGDAAEEEAPAEEAAE